MDSNHACIGDGPGIQVRYILRISVVLLLLLLSLLLLSLLLLPLHRTTSKYNSTI